MDLSAATYSAQGELLCRRCSAVAEVGQGEERVVGGIKATGYLSLICAVTSWVANPYLVLTLLAFLGAIRTLTILRRHPEYHTRLGSHLGALRVASVLTFVVGAGPLFFTLMSLASR